MVDIITPLSGLIKCNRSCYTRLETKTMFLILTDFDIFSFHAESWARFFSGNADIVFWPVWYYADIVHTELVVSLR